MRDSGVGAGGANAGAAGGALALAPASSIRAAGFFESNGAKFRLVVVVDAGSVYEISEGGAGAAVTYFTAPCTSPERLILASGRLRLVLGGDSSPLLNQAQAFVIVVIDFEA